ncbi:MAG: T9SS type A sorting domain-containing protein [Marinoscillum sp.]
MRFKNRSQALDLNLELYSIDNSAPVKVADDGTPNSNGGQTLNITTELIPGTYFIYIHDEGNNSTSQETYSFCINCKPKPIEVTISENICAGDAFIFGLDTLINDGTYISTFKTTTGRDSIVTLSLVVNPTFNETVAMNICDGESYLFGTQELNSEGSFTEIFQSQAGCDSTVILNLDVESLSVEVTQTSGVLAALENNSSYQWIDCVNDNLPISGATSQSFQPVESGEYSVRIIKNGCEITSECLAITIKVLGSFTATEDIKIYPNPIADYLTLDVPNNFDGNYRISDISGKTVYSNSLNGKTKVMLALQSGTFIIVITDSQGNSFVDRIVKE